MSSPSSLSCLLLALCAAAVAAEPLPTPRVEGEVLHADELEIIGLRFTDVVAVPRLEAGVLRFEQLAAKAYEGRLGGSIAVDLADGSMRLNLVLGEVDLGDFLERFAGSAGSGFDGKISGRIALQLPRGDWRRASGDAEIALGAGSLVNVPGFTALLLGDPESGSGSDRGRARLRIENGRISIVDCVIDNPAYHVQVKGHVEADGRLALRVSPFAHLDHLKAVPALGDVMSYLLGELSGRAARFSVTGHITAPQVEYSPF